MSDRTGNVLLRLIVSKNRITRAEHVLAFDQLSHPGETIVDKRVQRDILSQLMSVDVEYKTMYDLLAGILKTQKDSEARFSASVVSRAREYTPDKNHTSSDDGYNKSEAEAAKILGVHRETLAKWRRLKDTRPTSDRTRKRGDNRPLGPPIPPPPCRRVGNRYKYRLEDLINWRT